MVESNEMGKWLTEKTRGVVNAIWMCVRIVFFVACCYFMFTAWQFYKSVERGEIAKLANQIKMGQSVLNQERANLQMFIDDIGQADCAGLTMDAVFEKYKLPIDCGGGIEQ